MNEEQKVYAQIQKDKIDTIVKNDKEWQDFLKLKRQAINTYGGDNNAAKLVYGEREAALLATFKDRQGILDTRELDRWDQYHDGQTIEETFTPAHEIETKELSSTEKAASNYEENRQEMLGKRAEQTQPEPPKLDGLDKTATDFEQLLQSERDKRQHRQIDRSGLDAIDTEKNYNKTVSVEFAGVREETKQERIERKMREWDDSQKEKTQQRDHAHTKSL